VSVAVTTTLVAAAAAALALVGSAGAARAVQPALSPFNVSSSAGASVAGMTEYEAEGPNASTNGTRIGPDYTQGDLATEASGREAVQLTSQGQYVQFTLTAPANALDIHYALNQGASGKLSVYINGTKYSQELSLSSQYDYISTGDITGSKTHHFYDDARLLLTQNLSAGTVVKFQVDSDDSAVPYTIDLADFYEVPAAISQPANSISVVSEGADPTGQADSSNAFRQAISAAASAGESVWVPQGTFLVSSALQVNKATIEGAGDWYTQIKSNELIDNTSAVSGPVNLSNFAILGSTVGRNDSSTENAIDGSLGSGAVVNGLWIQDTNVGFWLQYGNSNLTVENCEIFDTDADGLNFNGNATNSTVTNNFIRNTGDDGIAIWSYPALDSGITVSYNTVSQPNLANGIAEYGGTNNTVDNNVIADSNALGSGLDISNEQFLSPGFTPLAGTITVSGNALLRDGALNPNWGHPMGAVQIDAYDYAISNVTINLDNTTIIDSPYEAFEIVSGDGTGLTVTGLNINGATVEGTGTTVFQAETGGSASVSNVVASDVGVAGTYNYGYPSNTAGLFTFNLGSGNSGWSTTPVLTSYPSPVTPTATASAPPSGGGTPPPTTAPPTTAPPTSPPSGTNLALNKSTTSSGYTQTYTPANAVDGNTNTYWESADNAFPQWIQVDLGASYSIGSVTLDLPPSSSWGTRTQTLSVLGSTNGSSYTTLVGSTNYTFNPSTGNTVTITFPTTAARYVKLNFTANTAWPAGQLSEFEVFSAAGATSAPTTAPPTTAPPTTPPSNTNLALNQSTTSSGYTQTYTPANAVDGNTNTYWESADNAFPQWIQVDLGSSHSISRIVLDLPPSSSWGTRTQTLSVLGSTNGSSYTTLVGSTNYTFNPSTGNTVTITFSATSTQYVKLNFTANTAWPAGQLSEFQVYSS
jgi:F5/8 type C domain/Pectate lyase superfamily protein